MLTRAWEWVPSPPAGHRGEAEGQGEDGPSGSAAGSVLPAWSLPSRHTGQVQGTTLSFPPGVAKARLAVQAPLPDGRHFLVSRKWASGSGLFLTELGGLRPLLGGLRSMGKQPDPKGKQEVGRWPKSSWEWKLPGVKAAPGPAPPESTATSSSLDPHHLAPRSAGRLLGSPATDALAPGPRREGRNPPAPGPFEDSRPRTGCRLYPHPRSSGGTRSSVTYKPQTCGWTAGEAPQVALFPVC